MGLQWIDTIDIAIELAEAHPDVDPRYIRFTDLHRWTCALENFTDDPERSGEVRWWRSRLDGVGIQIPQRGWRGEPRNEEGAHLGGGKCGPGGGCNQEDDWPI